MLDKEVIGKRLVELRGEKTQSVVAGKLGITTAALSNYEIGIRIPRDEVKKSIADYYGKTVQEIFFD